MSAERRCGSPGCDVPAEFWRWDRVRGVGSVRISRCSFHAKGYDGDWRPVVDAGDGTPKYRQGSIVDYLKERES